MPGRIDFRFAWWNLESFSHFTKEKAGEDRWPSTLEQYQAKCERIDRALLHLCSDRPPDVMVFGEITNQAALDLQKRIFPNHKLFSLDFERPRSELEVAFLYAPAADFEEQSPIVVPRMPRGTRPMGVLDYHSSSHRIRIIACHWAARFDESAEDRHSDMAKHLNGEIYEFLHRAPDGEKRHVLILGDLNQEPYEPAIQRRLHAAREHDHARRKEHYSDKDTQRTRLYNCAWRFMGENRPHDGNSSSARNAGTYYWEKKNCWRTIDHVIVSGSLLTEEVPFLDEARLHVVLAPSFVGDDGRPRKFRWNGGRPSGVSDHLPILGHIVLKRD